MVLQWKSTFLECRGLASRNQLCIVRSMSGGDFTALFKFDARDSRLWLWLRLKDPENWPKLENSQRKKGRLRGPDASLPLWCHTRSELGSVSHGLRYKDARSVMRPYFYSPLFMSYPFNNPFGTRDFMDESQQQHSPTTGYPQWETIERGEQQRPQLESPLDTSMDSTTPTGPTPIAFRSINIEMDEMSHNIMPASAAQIDDTPITLHHPHALHQQQLHLQQQHHQQQQFLQQQHYHLQSRHPSVEPFSTHSSRPGSSSQLHIVTSPTDLFRPQSTTPLPNPTMESGPGPSTSNTAGRRGTRKTSGPIRSSGRVTRSQQQAPYHRPSPASTAASFLGVEVPHAGSGSSASSTPRIPQQAEPTQRKQTVRFTAPTIAPAPIQTRAASRAASSSMMPSPVVKQSSPISELPESSGSAAT